MANPFAKFAAGFKATPTSESIDDDISVATPTMGEKPKPKERETNEIVIAFSYTETHHGAGSASFSTVHAHILHAIQQGLPADTHIFDNKNAKVPLIDPITWSSSISSLQRFKVHLITANRHRPAKYMIAHRIHTQHSLTTIKQLDSVQKLLKQYKVYMTNHPWPEDEVDTVQLAFLLGYHPTHMTSAQAEQALANKFAQAKSKPPPFRCVFTTIRMKHEQTILTTKVYAIQVQRGHTKRALKAIAVAFGDTSTDIMLARMRYHSPNSFLNGIKKQIKYLSQTYVVPLIHLSPTTYFYLEPQIRGITGVLDIVPGRDVKQSGRYQVMVHRHNYKQVRHTLITSLQSVYLSLDSDQQELFQGYQPSVANQSSSDDMDSEGGESFMSASAASFATMTMSKISEDNPSVNTPATYRSYAHVTAPPTVSSMSTSQPASTEVAALQQLVQDLLQNAKKSEERMQRMMEQMTAMMQLHISTPLTTTNSQSSFFPSQATSPPPAPNLSPTLSQQHPSIESPPLVKKPISHRSPESTKNKKHRPTTLEPSQEMDFSRAEDVVKSSGARTTPDEIPVLKSGFRKSPRRGGTASIVGTQPLPVKNPHQ